MNEDEWVVFIGEMRGKMGKGVKIVFITVIRSKRHVTRWFVAYSHLPTSLFIFNFGWVGGSGIFFSDGLASPHDIPTCPTRQPGNTYVSNSTYSRVKAGWRSMTQLAAWFRHAMLGWHVCKHVLGWCIGITCWTCRLSCQHDTLYPSKYMVNNHTKLLST